ncbi:MAG: hypothetical protein OXF19_06090 [Hyphomicrobiales bacterium]|nr:hypothetical protein [Hyphomicrobiales bacterium]
MDFNAQFVNQIIRYRPILDVSQKPVALLAQDNAKPATLESCNHFVPMPILNFRLWRDELPNNSIMPLRLWAAWNGFVPLIDRYWQRVLKHRIMAEFTGVYALLIWR